VYFVAQVDASYSKPGDPLLMWGGYSSLKKAERHSAVLAGLSDKFQAIQLWCAPGSPRLADPDELVLARFGIENPVKD
jgi:hypothetical protein